ncbi:MAG: hypothetical protein ABSF26_20165 [Thermoguttaceae bacterium]|jgi:hypothetical protein
MTGRSLRTLGWLGGLGLLCAWGCSNVPKAPPLPQVDAAKAAAAAMAQYDTNGDGKLDAKELGQSPALQSLLATVKKHDPSHGDWLTADDIAGRITSWLKGNTTVWGGVINVSMDGKPLEGAVVTLEPEPWLGPSYHASTSTTNAGGCAITSPTLAAYPGIYVGVYRVKISKKVGGQETIPERYNEKTVLGREVAEGVPDAHLLFQFKIESK